MDIRLKFEPVATNAPLFAADIVEAAQEIDGLHLGYEPASLGAVDERIEQFRVEGLTDEQIAATLFGFGCYVGEVFVRHAGGVWRETGSTPMRDLAAWPFVIELADGRYCNPIGKVFKRLENGPEDDL